MRNWRYEMPPIQFLLHGRSYRGTVAARTRVDARAALKRQLRLKRVPPHTLLAPV